MARKANLKKGMKGPQKMRYQMGGKMKGIVQNASAIGYNSSFGDKGQYQPPMSITSSMLKSLAGYGAESRASMGAAEVKPKKKQLGGMMKGNKATAKPPMKPMGKKNNTKTTKL